MTYEELKEKLADIAHEKDAHEARNDFLLALLAVVEEHKPTELSWSNETGEYYCDTCDNLVWVPYPCQTIKAIQKELM
jgi:hypothetical protein